jgi:hypothetical protein
MSNNDEIGFGKPPKRSQFQKGVSGNPSGRPRGSRNLATVLARALREKVVVNENGHRRTMSKLDAAVAQLVNKSASGDLAALRQLMALAGSAEQESTNSTKKQIDELDAKVMKSVLKRLEGCSPEEEDDD